MTPTQTLLAICDLAELPPIIPPWPFVQVEPAWPVRVQPWPPVEVGMIIDPDDPWSEAYLYDEVTGYLLPPRAKS